MSASDLTTPELPQARGTDTLGPTVKSGSTSGAGRAAAVDAKPAIVIPDLPWSYQDDRLVLLTRDPRTLFAYWDCAIETVKRAREEVPNGVAVLRLFLIGGGEPRVVREEPVEIDQRSCYLFELDPNHDYRVELALRAESGAQRLLLKSNVSALPQNAPSQWIEDRLAALPVDVPLPAAALFLTGRTAGDKKRQMHVRSYQLSIGKPEVAITGDAASSAQGIHEGFGGRSWSSGTVANRTSSGEGR